MNYLQGVQKLMGGCFALTKTEANDTGSGLFSDISPYSRILSRMRSSMPHIRLSRVSALIRRQATWTFWMRVFSEAAGSILLSSALTNAQRFSIGERSRLLPDHVPFSQKPGKLPRH